jgi:hypothetical protein
MAFAENDLVIPAGSFNGNGAVADLSVGTLCPEGLTMGIFRSSAPYNVWSTGATQASATFSTENLRLCSVYTGPDLLNKAVGLPGKGPAFRGVVTQVLNTELDDTGGDGTQVPVVVVRTADFFYVAEPSSLEEL